MITFDSNCFYIIQCLALVFLAAPCVLFAGGMLICGLMWCGLHITRAMSEIARVERAAKAAGMSYGQYVARYDPPKARPKPQKERYHDL